STLVVMAGEFGRTPLGENRTGSKAVTGRDHHPGAFSLWMAGGGVKGGQVIGKTTELGWSVEEDPVHINDFHATLLHLFGMNHLKLAQNFGGLDIRLTNVGGKIVEKLIA
ncbi:MAG TPA: sulfatase, partial [Planctomycetaceae bacterium]|nr:sulfatase [Planctomycetaceae bacterium]